MLFNPLGKTGIDVSVIGFGGAPLGNEFGGIDVAEGDRAVHLAIERGLNFFDTSPYYGRTLSESRLGDALQGRRHQIILSSKCGRYDVASFDFSESRVKSSVDESLRRLKTDHLDLLIAHDIEFADREQIIHETVPAMRDLQRKSAALRQNSRRWRLWPSAKNPRRRSDPRESRFRLVLLPL
jgi:L-galactose dehydrogenase